MPRSTRPTTPSAVPTPPPAAPPALRRSLGAGVGALTALVLAACSSAPDAGGTGGAGSPATTSSSSAPSTSTAPATSLGTPSASASAAAPARVALTAPEDVATGLAVPWSGAVLPDGAVLVSERNTGAVKRIPAGGGAAETIGTVQGVVAAGEGGLLGLAIDPATYAATPVLYAYLTAADDNRVVRIAVDGGRLGGQTPVLTGIPKGSIHNGGRIKVGPDGFLYVATGETGRTGLSQEQQNLGGKILRITTDGQPAPGNPVAGSPVWSWGHRNVQGLAWSADGRMWASEFGQNTWDELNQIRAGANYGWPTVEGVAGRDGFVDPVRQWSTDEASPSGIAVGPDGSVLVAALRGQSLWKVPVGADGSTGEPERLLDGEYGRIRDVFVGPDGNVWIITNNTSRGQARDGDDRVVRLPQSLTG